jgi:arylformamidase
MTTIDYEAEYNNRARVPDHAAIFARWAKDAAGYRAEMADNSRSELGISYGPSQRQFIDLFFSADSEDPPIALFIHGGYWRSLEPSIFSHVARGPNAHHVTVALADYDLCPAVTIQTIIDQTRNACLYLWERFAKRVTVYGHSAGGHLAACLLATDWKTLDPTAPSDLVPAAYSISGLFDLAPLVRVSMNDDLRLTEQDARKVSPLYWPVPAGRILDAIVGGAESSEFLRQSRIIADEWKKKGAQTRYEEIPGANHFTVVDPLADPESAMVQRLVALCEAAHKKK